MRALIGLIAVTAMLATSGCGESRPTKLEKATDNCLQSGSEWAEVHDEGKALHLQVQGFSREGLKREEADCVLKAVDAPDAVFTKIDNTTAGGGEQTASWDGYAATWRMDVMDGTGIQVMAK